MMNHKLWDIFCRVIDNHGDLGVCWRLACELASRSQQVRLWVDEPGALAWMAPDGCANVQVFLWAPDTPFPEPGHVVVEAFGCEIAPSFIAAIASRACGSGRKGLKPPVWINLEYLSAQTFVERAHRLPSPVFSGPGAGLTKHFFYPGFTPATGGLLREANLPQRQARFDRAAWLAQQGVAWQGERLVSLFCYEPPGLLALLVQLAQQALAGQPTRLLVTHGRAAHAVQAALVVLSQNSHYHTSVLLKQLSFSYLPLLSQSEFDHLLWASDFNLVRGEDSLVRALWAARPDGSSVPFAWQIYPQQDGAHQDKLGAFLQMLAAPPDWQAFHQAWNGTAQVELPALNMPAWAAVGQATRSRLAAQTDLASQLIGFTQERG
jgi:uncharacterized repeat protein (TIGR03837 family)